MFGHKQALSGCFGLIFFSLSLPSNAQIPSSCPANQTEEECACEAALQANTLEALEEFLSRYPQRGNSACAARALVATEFISSEGDHNRNEGPVPVSGSPN